jgi:hypothetical protein
VASSDRGRFWRQVLLAVTFVLFSSVGLLILVGGRGSERVWGLMAVLLFGVGGVTYFLLPRLTREGGEGIRLGTAKFRATTRPALIFEMSRRKRRLAAAGTTAFTVVGVLMVVYADALADEDVGRTELVGAGLLAAAVFGLFTILLVAAEFMSAAYVALLPEGVLGGGPFGSSFIPWDAIADVAIVEVKGSPMVGITALDPAAIEAPAVFRGLSRAFRGATGADLTYAGLVAPLETLRDAIAYYRERADERALIGTEDRARFTGSGAAR